ncbi:AlpA family phage regulatory protein [Dyella marensis]|uniref:helix-turn-helix transcriptional regulator n=1 Tax=Dyella marensis TaxID=500610 RepID=UPI00338C5AA7
MTQSNYLTIKDVLQKLNMKSASTIYRWIDKGKFPAPVKLGLSSRWVESEVNAWMKEKENDRPGAQAPQDPARAAA